MKTWLWLVLTILTLTIGCAQGYSDQPAGLPGTGGDHELVSKPGDRGRVSDAAVAAKMPAAIEVAVSYQYSAFSGQPSESGISRNRIFGFLWYYLRENP